MALPMTAILSCCAAAVLDIMASALATVATAPREGTCDGSFYLCSFRDLLPLAFFRVLALIVTTLATYIITRTPKAQVI